MIAIFHDVSEHLSRRIARREITGERFHYRVENIFNRAKNVCYNMLHFREKRVICLCTECKVLSYASSEKVRFCLHVPCVS